MGAGVASLGTFQKKEFSGAGPPFAAGSANNGLSVDSITGKIVLGNTNGTGAGGSAMLLNTREIDSGNFGLVFRNFPVQQSTAISGSAIVVNDAGNLISTTIKPNLITINDTNNNLISTLTPATLTIFDPVLNFSQHSVGNFSISNAGATIITQISQDTLSFINTGAGTILQNNAGVLEFRSGANTLLGNVNLTAGANAGRATFVQFVQTGDNNLIIKRVTGGNLLFGVSLANQGAVERAAFMFNEATGEVRIGATAVSYFPVIRSNGVAAATWDTAAAPNVTNAGSIRSNGASGFILGVDTTILHSVVALFNGSGAQVGTLANAPTAGNPTKWLRIDDNGTNRFIPSW